MSKLRDKKWEKRGSSNKGQNGITLIALVITVIVLLILAGISIMMLTGDNSILKNATEAKVQTAHKKVYEAINLEATNWLIESSTGGYSGGIIEYLLEKGYIYEVADVDGYVVNTVNLMGSKQDYGNGTDGKTDVYKIEEVNTVASVSRIASTQMIKIATTSDATTSYEVIYYGEDSTDVVDLGPLIGNGSTQTDTASLPTGNGTKPYLPSSSFSRISETNLSTGLVIRDNVGNEYVWIEVPNYYDETTATWIGPDYSAINSSADYDNIELALQNYASKYRTSGHKDEWYDGNGATATGSSSSSSSSSGSTSTSSSDSESTSSSGSSTVASDLEDTSGCGLTYVQYTTLKHKMLTSIYENGGFWIGRYEAGISAPRTSHSDVTTSTEIKALSQQNQYPLNYIYCSEAQILASKVATDAGLEDYTTSLMFGIQWDLVLRYLESKGATEYELKSNSKNWGNYYDNLWTVTNTSAKYYYNSGWTNGAYGTKSSNRAILLSTGADSSFSKMNIYDLAGNVQEWTLEEWTDPYVPCSIRGGKYGVYGGTYPAREHSHDSTTFSYASIGFRVSLY